MLNAEFLPWAQLNDFVDSFETICFIVPVRRNQSGRSNSGDVIPPRVPRSKNMQETTTSRWATIIRNTCDRVEITARARKFSKILLGALLLYLAVTINLQGQQLSEDAALRASRPPSNIAGTVRDTRGVPLAGIEVRVLDQNNNLDFKQTTDNNGGFTFNNLPAGIYQVKIDMAGLQPFASDPLVVAAGVTHQLPIVAMRMAIKTTTVDVNASLREIAEAEVKQEEKQRLLGFLPNYYTSYIWNAAPMTPKLKFGMAFRAVTDPAAFLVVAGIAGAEQYHKTFPGYGQGAEGYAKRFGSAYADTVASKMLGSAVFAVLFHQDPRYFYRGSGSVRSRLTYAVMSAVICRGDNGRLQPSYSRILGGFAAAGISNLYKSPQDREVGLTLRNGLIVTAAAAGVNVMREFLFRKLTPGVPASQNGKP